MERQANTAPEQSASAFLRESRALLREEFRAVSATILKLSRGEVKSYTLDTGQNSQTVTRQDLPALIQQQKTLLSALNEINEQLGDTPGVPAQCVQGVPAW